ncbi:sialidase family protein [Massilibacteroides sp.]|uniref:sialidase family protein n=1 Tax=Massilibacteroides sp. TaxID=2034766 RepID=UPI002606B923|nr:sialidase family protein [Massilibacteroides sp.]MDD4515889.1 sialidase family protein [Massilibacteroides sp.]
MRNILWIILCFSSIMSALFAQTVETLPWVDLSRDKNRHIIIAQGTETLYNGHPTTVKLGDNKTIFCSWSYDHGGKLGFLAVSKDAGLTWENLPIPNDWKETRNCPSIYLLKDKSGVERLMLFAAHPEMPYTYSEDLGKTWTSMKSLGMPCVMAFSSVTQLSNGDYLGLYHRGHNDKDKSPLTLWQSKSIDGGVTWNAPILVGKKDGKSPCEPFVLKSPDGKTLVCVARENQRKGHSLMMTSTDEGETWSEMTETIWGLTGDRHIIKYTPDNRLVAVFRDMAPNSPTKGHFVAWVGTYNDIKNGYSGQYKIKLLHNNAGPDCGYPGLEILLDGTIIATTYVKYEPGKKKHSVVSVRFKLEETDAMVSLL